jgi:glycosyltransferase involved in cell wall biosynthesis
VQHRILTIDARLLFSWGVGTYLQNLLKRIRFESLGLKIEICARDEYAASWIGQYQSNATLKICPLEAYGFKEQLFWLKNLRGGLFWAPNFNIPWGGYEKLIATVHDCHPLTPLESYLNHMYAQVMFARLSQKADAIITVSDFSRRELQSQAKVLDTPIYTIPNGVDPYWFASQKPPRIYHFPYFVFVGNASPHKNLLRLLRAFNKIHPAQKLICVGAFEDPRQRQSKAGRLLKKMSERVIVTGRVGNEELRAIVKNADGLILPSLYEGFGLPAVEAMAAKVPVLVSETSALPEVCGKGALYCDPYTTEGIAEGLEALVNLKGEELQRRVEEGSEHARQYNWDASARATLEVFKSALT